MTENEINNIHKYIDYLFDENTKLDEADQLLKIMLLLAVKGKVEGK